MKQIATGSEVASVANLPLLRFNSDSNEAAFGTVSVSNLDPNLLVRLRREAQAVEVLQSMFRVAVARTGLASANVLPDVFGHYEVLEDGLRFTPHFPFERGLLYRASFNPRPFARPGLADVETLEFSLAKVPSASPTVVQHIFPSSDWLPENLLRFYVSFSNSMQRGRVEAEVALLGPDGEPAPDVLYRAPVELWDRSMQHLTVLLDPGRLKRGVGPNRELGPPLRNGRAYTLAIGAGMLDLYGRRLTQAAYKRFRVTEAVRENIAVEHWKIVLPASQSHEPLVLRFPRPLDRALLANTINITSEGGRAIDGRIAIDEHEKRWSFTPTETWGPGSYNVRVGSSLEDVCGNSILAPFDRPIRSGTNLSYEVASRSIAFNLAPFI